MFAGRLMYAAIVLAVTGMVVLAAVVAVIAVVLAVLADSHAA
jgi:hypothetical protein